MIKRPPTPLHLTEANPVEPIVKLVLECGCKIEPHSGHGLKVTYCKRHSIFVYSPHGDGQDVFYFLTEDNQP